MEEVTVNIYPEHVDPYADIYSSLPEWTRKLLKLIKDYPDKTSVLNTDSGVVVRVPRDWIHISPPKEDEDGRV